MNRRRYKSFLKKGFLYKIWIILVILLFFCVTHVFANKKDLEDTHGNGYLMDEFNELCDKVYAVFKGDTVEEEYEIENLTDKQLNALTNPTGAMLGNKNTQKKQQEMRDALLTEWKKRADEYGIEYDDSSDSIYSKGYSEYYSPKKVGGAGTTGSNLENVIDSANEFVDEANDTANVKTSALQDFSNTFYGIFLAVATAVTVIVGIIIGIKYMVSSAGERANVKQMLIPYVVGCIVVYGSFGIWALVVALLDSM